MEFKPAARVISRQKQDFAPKRGTFRWFRVHVGLDRGNKRRFRVHVPHKNTPGDRVDLTLHGRPVTQTRNQRIMERYEFSETEKQLLQALSKNKKPEELEQQFDKDVLEAHLNRLQELKMAVAHFSEDGVVAAWLTPDGSAYMKENPNLDPPLKTEVERLQKKNLQLDIELKEANRKLSSWKRLAVILGVLGTIIGGVLGALGIIEKVRHLFLGG